MRRKEDGGIVGFFDRGVSATNGEAANTVKKLGHAYLEQTAACGGTKVVEMQIYD